jgi:hypothetical protein
VFLRLVARLSILGAKLNVKKHFSIFPDPDVNNLSVQAVPEEKRRGVCVCMHEFACVYVND